MAIVAVIAASRPASWRHTTGIIIQYIDYVEYMHKHVYTRNVQY